MPDLHDDSSILPTDADYLHFQQIKAHRERMDKIRSDVNKNIGEGFDPKDLPRQYRPNRNAMHPTKDTKMDNNNQDPTAIAAAAMQTPNEVERPAPNFMEVEQDELPFLIETLKRSNDNLMLQLSVATAKYFRMEDQIHTLTGLLEAEKNALSTMQSELEQLKDYMTRGTDESPFSAKSISVRIAEMAAEMAAEMVAQKDPEQI